MVKKLLEKAKDWIIETTWAWILLMGTGVIAGMPYFTEVWSVPDAVACVAAVMAFLGFVLRWRNPPAPSIPEQVAVVAGSAPSTALRILGRSVTLQAEGHILVKVVVLNELPTATIVVTSAMLRPYIIDVDIAESDVKRISTAAISVPPRGTADVNSFVHLSGVALSQYREKVANYNGFLSVGIDGRLMVTGPWVGEAPFPVTIGTDWFLADGNIMFEAREARRRTQQP